jgi:hypothetical protein
MTSRQGLCIALVGLMIGVLCAIPALVIPDTGTPETGGATNITMAAIVLVYLGGFVGLVVMIVGLVIAAVGALTISTP